MDGTWRVDSTDIVPDAAYIEFIEPDADGVSSYGFYLPPNEALKFGLAVVEKARELGAV